jgi:hypothetical protein
MKSLEAFVKQRNAFNKMFKSPELSLSSSADRQKIADIIDSALSPENLTCDGELSASQVRSRYKELTTVARELKAYDPSVTFYEYS